MDQEFKSFLVCRSGTRSCGLPLDHVIEMMRALPVEIFPGMLRFMSGMALIRSAMVPVVDLATLLGVRSDAARYYVTMQAGHHQIACAVDQVSGVRKLPVSSLGHWPPLLGETGHEFVRAIGQLDAELFLVLEASRVIPDAAWQQLDALGRAV